MKKQSILKQLLALTKISFFFSILVLTIAIASCNNRTDKSNTSSTDKSDSISLAPLPNDSLDAIVLVLVEASSKDFHDHQPPVAVGFRNVQLKDLVGEDAEHHYMICGQFLSADKQSKDEWTAFATIKTSGYEQWIGNQSLGYCQDAKEVAYKTVDLSSLLKSKFDSLQK